MNIESSSFSGVVRNIGETTNIRGFIWNYGGEMQKFIRKATEIELENLGLN